MTPFVRTGLAEHYPYSFSRWTDVPAAKWPWFQDTLKKGNFFGMDPSTGVPCRWSLRPEDTLGLIFWTKNPKNLLQSELKSQYSVQVHVTVTGWEEVEKGAPSLKEGALLLRETARVYGPQHTFWRFSPIPLVDEVLPRFRYLLPFAADYGLDKVYLSYLQPNDLLPETRGVQERYLILNQLAELADPYGIKVLLCNEDNLLRSLGPSRNLESGVCAPPEYYSLPNREQPPSEGCGCVLMVDPFNINESCTYGCSYCYAADKTLNPKRKNTTLPIYGV